ncbi:outer membrane protein OmpW [Marinobacter vulgaris]|uniref:Outer membrane protein OmpW n=1 Tax=Marinobacter vulgaris TaxID=1928331 RepID=A0A2V3ZNQ6_9GAMM|nr:OmpW family outer membrane protein [Marinobacter vulgaris]PXX92712.1 outer membrane protein OmpW [Marinobacter vulgaris]TSJ71339.1 outer membrane beta-barrel protein [Marinobacter vulgaris]
MSRTFKLGVLAAAVMAVAPAAQAFEAGDFILRAGVAHVAPDDSSDVITAGGSPLAPDARVGVDSNSQLGIRATYMFTSNLGVGLLAATPFKHDIRGEGDIASLGKVAETKHLPPTLTLQYFPMNSTSSIQPYVGVGVNYTTFFEEKTAGALEGLDIELDDSVGVAAEIGLDYMLSEQFGLNAAIWWADIDTEADIETLDTFDVEIDPMVYMVGFSYKF